MFVVPVVKYYKTIFERVDGYIMKYRNAKRRASRLNEYCRFMNKRKKIINKEKNKNYKPKKCFFLDRKEKINK